MMRAILDRLLPNPRRRLGLRFDRLHNIETTEIVTVDHFIGMSAELREYAGAYVPTNPSLFKRIVRKSGIDPSAFTFVDLGCGKGRILIAAAPYPFKEVIGVEADATICEAARENIRRSRQNETQRVRIVHADARKFDLPDGNLFVFMYSPFRGPIFAEVAKRLGEAAAEPGRAVVIAYSGHWEAEALERTRRFTRRRMRRLQFWRESSVSFFYNELADKLRRKSFWDFGG